MKQRVTLKDIAKQAGVSEATVSQTLSGKGRISQTTRERVLEVVEELSYQPDEAARSLARRRAAKLPDTARSKTQRRETKRMPSLNLVNLVATSELIELVRMEIQQKEEEGFKITPHRDIFDAENRWTRRKLYRFYRDLSAAPTNPDDGYEEPDALEGIQEARPDGPREDAPIVTQSALYDSIYGAWLGRCAGCVLGKPVEAGWSKRQLIQYLKLANAYPLADYIPRLVPSPPSFDLNPESEGTFLDEIEGVPYDDDIDFTILGLHILETHGLSFSTDDVGTEWLGHLPYFRVYTAERIAYRNLVLNLSPPDTALTLNPAREFIGARIRADVYGLATPGKPELAAALAYRDARLSHVKNGVYSAMFMAAMISWAFVSNDVREIVEVGLSEIPHRSRLAEAVCDVLALRNETSDWEIAHDRLILKYGSYHPVHAINNTAWVVLALLFSDGDFSNGICTAVTCGLDTDCNGASVGSIMGVMHGNQNIPKKWTAPLQDTVCTTISRWRERRISSLARRTAKIAEETLSSSN